MKPTRAEKLLSHLFQNLSPSPRIQIILAIGEGEACVCHLEAMLGLRQAYISQHLMSLREAKLVTPRREGRNIYYRLANPDLLNLIRQAGAVLSLTEDEIRASGPQQQVPDCPCPYCNEAPVPFVPATAVSVLPG